LQAGEKVLKCTTHLVGHCFREIESALQDVLLPDGLSAEEEKKGKAKQDSHRRKVQAILDKYGIDPGADVAKLWMRAATREDEAAFHRTAHRNGLDAPRAYDEPFQSYCHELEALLDAVLDRFVAQFLDELRRVDELAQTQSPTTEHVKRLRLYVPNNPLTLARFFEQIDERWLVLLREGRYFAEIPPPEALDDGLPRHRSWPASGYLARVVAKAGPDTLHVIGDIALTVPATENPWVNRDLAKIALAVPIDAAARLAQRLGERLAGSSLGLADDLGTLAERLAAEGRTSSSEELVRALVRLEIVEDSNA
jgi:hypothetical protein